MDSKILSLFTSYYVLFLSIFVLENEIGGVNGFTLLRHHHSVGVLNQRGRCWKGRRTMVMKVRVGIIGLPNVGKSTLFNALAQKSIAQSANFPFCTIEPNVAPIPIFDQYLTALCKTADSLRAVPATIDWIDVAGLVEGASRGEGLGNRFLATVRECHAICHLIRYYHDPSIVHVNGKVDPVTDAAVINLELILADLAHVERRLGRIHNDKYDDEKLVLEKVKEGLEKGIPARSLALTPPQIHSIKSMGLLTLKPVIYLFNVDEVDFVLDREQIEMNVRQLLPKIDYCDLSRDSYAIVSAKLETEVAAIGEQAEQVKYLESLGMIVDDNKEYFECLSHHVLPLMVKRLLQLSTVYTGPGVPPNRSRTTRAHLFQSGSMTAEGLASRIHGDIQKGFIRAEVLDAKNLLEHSNLTAAKEAGSVRSEGRDYVLQSDEVILIKWK